MGQQQLPPDQLQAVRNQINALSVPQTKSPIPAPFVPPSQNLQPQHPPPPQQRPQQLPLPPNPSLQASLDSRNLADIIARAQRNPATPPTSQASLPQQQAPPISASQPQAPNAPNDLLASLRASGFFSAASNTPVNGSLGITPPSSVVNTSPTVAAGLDGAHPLNDVELTSVSLKK